MEIDVTKCEYYTISGGCMSNEKECWAECCSKNNDCKFKQLERYKQAIEEIKEIAEQQVPYINLGQVKTCIEVEYDYVGKIWNLEQKMHNILQKIAECEVRYFTNK